MGMMTRLLDLIFGGGRNVLRDTVEIFHENAESSAARDQKRHSTAMAQFGSEFLPGPRGRFDRLMDAINRLPRPMMALGCLGLFVSAMIDPIWFAARMQGIALVPEPLWWLFGVVVSFYFGARHQMKGQEFQRNMVRNMSQHRALLQQTQSQASHLISTDDNPALQAWEAQTKAS